MKIVMNLNNVPSRMLVQDAMYHYIQSGLDEFKQHVMNNTEVFSDLELQNIMMYFDTGKYESKYSFNRAMCKTKHPYASAYFYLDRLHQNQKAHKMDMERSLINRKRLEENYEQSKNRKTEVRP